MDKMLWFKDNDGRLVFMQEIKSIYTFPTLLGGFLEVAIRNMLRHFCNGKTTKLLIKSNQPTPTSNSCEFFLFDKTSGSIRKWTIDDNSMRLGIPENPIDSIEAKVIKELKHML